MEVEFTSHTRLTRLLGSTPRAGFAGLAGLCTVAIVGRKLMPLSSDRMHLIESDTEATSRKSSGVNTAAGWAPRSGSGRESEKVAPPSSEVL